MPTKRTYVQSGPPLKRAKTLTQEVAKLKKQVSQNKHELKYFDDIVEYDTSSSIALNSFLIKPQAAGNPNITRVPFIGRKIYVHKIEYRYELATSVNESMIIYRCKKNVKNALSSQMPLGMDPELHTMLRFNESNMDTQKTVYHGTIDFKKSPRLVEFDNSDGLTDATITVGDIRLISSVDGRPVSFRLWYHDG